MEQLHCTWWTAAHQRPTFLVVSICSLPINRRSLHKLIVLQYHQCFAVVGQLTWNSLPDSLHDPALSLSMYRRQQKMHFFVKYWRHVYSTIERFESALYKLTLDFLLYVEEVDRSEVSQVSLCRWVCEISISKWWIRVLFEMMKVYWNCCVEASSSLTVGELLRQALERSGRNDIDDWFLQEVVCAEELGQFKWHSVYRLT